MSVAILTFSSCSEDEEIRLDSPEVTAPSINAVQIAQTVELSFDIAAEAGYSSANVTAMGGTVSILNEPALNETSGSVVVEFTAGNSSGAGSISLVVDDTQGTTGEATADFDVSESNVTTIIEVRNDITADITWHTGNVYELAGRITVLDGVTLSVEPGVIVKGQPGTDNNSKALVIARGGVFNANGTAEQPIIMTSTADQILPGQIASPNLEPTVSGLWGGLIILGKAPISAGGDVTEAQIEGIPSSDTNGLYGGDNPEDNSGTITYVSIRHGGTLIGSGNEINGLTLGGVGSATTINNIEVVGNQDDGIEWFGGNVDVTSVLIWNAGDDGLDTDQDWVGTCSNFIIVSPNGSAFELDGPEGTTSRGVHTFQNGIVYAGSDIDHLVDFDDATNAELINIYFYGWSADYDNPDDSEFLPVESFGGDGAGTSANWEYTLTDGGAPANVIFETVPEAALTEVGLNANTVGPDVSLFGWTWASTSGALSSIGLE